MRATLSMACATVLVSVLAAAPAHAACKRFAFLVNDYGKEGPTKDAQDLLDKNIAQWATQQGIKNYTTGKKSVSCELFLDFVVFDEHTCTATANVCWNGDGRGPAPAAVDGEQAVDATGAPPPPMRKAEALGVAAATHATAPASEAAPVAEAPAAAAPVAPVEQAAAPAAPTSGAPPAATAAAPASTPAASEPTKAVEAPAAASAAPASAPAASQPAKAAEATAPAAAPPVETGALPGDKPASAKPAAVTEKLRTVSDKERAAAAAAAATAAAAAERAATAAEMAASAAKEAAAAAVAASAASRGTFVAPLEHAAGEKPPHTE